MTGNPIVIGYCIWGRTAGGQLLILSCGFYEGLWWSKNVLLTMCVAYLKVTLGWPLRTCLSMESTRLYKVGLSRPYQLMESTWYLCWPWPFKTIRVGGWLCQHIKCVKKISILCLWAGCPELVISYVDVVNLSWVEIPLECRHVDLIIGNGSVHR